TSLKDANSSLGCQVMPAPSNTVEFQGATLAVVGHGAVLRLLDQLHALQRRPAQGGGLPPKDGTRTKMCGLRWTQKVSQVEHNVVTGGRTADEHPALSGRFNGVGAVVDIPSNERRFAGLADPRST